MRRTACERSRIRSVIGALGVAIVMTLGASLVAHSSSLVGIQTAVEGGSQLARSSASPASVEPLGGWWQLPTPESRPSNLTGFAMAYDSEDGDALLFGGCPATSGPALYGCPSPSNETWSFSNGTWAELHPSESPPGRYFGMMADDPAAGYVLLFGGGNGSALLNDTWAFSRGNWVELQPRHSPPPLEEAAIAYDRIASEIVLFGGLTAGALNASNETWTFDRGDWVNVTEPVGPPGWVSPTMAPDPVTGGVLLHGGISALYFPTYYQQTWSFGLDDEWINETAASGSEPPPSVLYSLATFDPVRNETLLFGGGDSTDIPSGTWAYTSSGVWQPLLFWNKSLPGAFYENGAVFDAGDNYTVEFGEESVGSFYGLPAIESVINSTWVLLPALISNGIEWNGSSSPSSEQTFFANVSGGLGPYQYNWSFSDGTFSNNSRPVHAFLRTGSFEVNVTITDRVGQKANASAFVNISSPVRGIGGSQLVAYGSLFAVAIIAVITAVALWRKRRTPPGAPPVRNPPPPSDEKETP